MAWAFAILAVVIIVLNSTIMKRPKR